MAEVIGVVSSVLAMAGAAISSAKTILELINDLKKANQEVDDIKKEIELLKSTLDEVYQVLSKENVENDNVKTAVEACENTLKELYSILQRSCPSLKDVGRRASFAEKLGFQKLRRVKIVANKCEIQNALEKLRWRKMDLVVTIAVGNRSILRKQRDEFLRLFDGGELNTKPWPSSLPRQSVIIKEERMASVDMFEPSIQEEKSRELASQALEDNQSFIELTLREAVTMLVKEKNREGDKIPNLQIESMKGLEDRLENLINAMKEEDFKGKHERFVRSLDSPNYQQDKIDADKASVDTCKWIEKHETYLDWQNLGSKFLLLSGKPGSGKTVMARYLLSQLTEVKEHDGEVRTLYYFCSNRNRPDESEQLILRALIHQLVCKSLETFSSVVDHSGVMDVFLSGKSNAKWSTNALWEIFKSAVTVRPTRVLYCVIDGVDECEHSSMKVLLGRIEIFAQSGDLKNTQLKILLTGRPNFDLELQSKTQFRIISMTPDLIRDDIDVFVGQNLQPLKKKLRLNDKEFKDIQATLVKRAEGMFLWAKLAVKQASDMKRLTVAGMKTLIQTLPTGLDALYESMLEGILRQCSDDLESVNFVQKVFTWVLLAKRPLTLSELQTAIAVEPGRDTLSTIEENKILTITQDIRQLCGSFLIIQGPPAPEQSPVHTNAYPSIEQAYLRSIPDDFQEDDELRTQERNTTVHLIHQSAKDYLLDGGRNLPGRLSCFRVDQYIGHCRLARTCLTYLRLKEFEIQMEFPDDMEKAPADTTSQLRQHLALKVKHYDLLHYATSHWAFHVESGMVNSEESELCQIVCNFLNDDVQCVRGWFQLFMFLWSDNIAFSRIFYGVVGLHIAAWLGLTPVVELLIDDKEADPNVEDFELETPLVYALGGLQRYGSESETVKNNYLDDVRTITALLKRKVDIEARNLKGYTPLNTAAGKGLYEVVKLLLDHGADKDTISDDLYSPISNAAENGYTEVVRLLCEYGAKVDIANCNGDTALHIAAEAGNLELMEILLATNVNINKVNEGGETPLFNSVRKGHAKAAGLLLNHNADINIVNNYDWTPLHLAVFYRNHSVVLRLLLERNVNINIRPWTPLHLAVADGNINIINCLSEHLENVLNSNFSHDYSNSLTPFEFSAFLGKEELTRALLQQLNSRKGLEDEQVEIKRIASSASHPGERMAHLMKTVVQIVRDEDIRSGRTFSAFHAAFSIGDSTVAKALLDAGISPYMIDRFGRSLLDVSLNLVVRQSLVQYFDVRNGASQDVFEHIEPSCVMWGRTEPHDFFTYGWCDGCGRTLSEDFFYHCCICTNDNFDLCTTCYDKEKRCFDDSHELLARFTGDRMLSFAEYSPWVAERRLPLVCMTVED